MDATIIIDSLPSLLKATLMTIFLAGISIVIALVIGFFTAIVRILKVNVYKRNCEYLCFYYSWNPTSCSNLCYLLWAATNRNCPRSDIFRDIGVKFKCRCVLSESFRASILAVDNGQMEAAMSMGMTYSQALRRIILPQSLRIAIPTLSNTFIVLIKDTSLVSVITVTELLQMSSLIIAKTFEPLTIYLLAAAIYWILITFLQCY